MLDNLKAGTRLLTAFLTVAILGAIVAAIGIVNMATMNEQAERTHDEELLGLSHAKEANIKLISIGRAARGVLVATTPDQVRRFSDQLDNGRRRLHKNLDQARPRYTLEMGKRLLAEVDRGVADYEAMLPELLTRAQDLTPEGKTAAAEFALGPLAAKANIVDDRLSALAHQKEKRSAQLAAASSQRYQGSQALMVALALGSLGTGVGLGFWITRGLTRQPGGAPICPVQAAGALAEGTLSTVIRTRPGANDSLLHAMKTMRAALVKIVAQVRSGSGTIAAASGQIAAGKLNLASRTGEQTTGIGQVNMAITRMDEVTRQTAALVEQAAAAAGSMQERAAHLAHVVGIFKLGNEDGARMAMPVPARARSPDAAPALTLL
ncbi:methyl-accepting chemotaxis protein [Massilia sp. CCM 9210]|uniref:HAMP domain-containing methyl-accepting chemotaxis protein n=1 Tax=Massilia scottii TaxID=3057166 RepID=UPI002796DA5C|nr:methyl-accepting chemotaxis protein [Massilia sp. CCM 9210]MDQ1813239.1 methyl-accepting chemotaxis protein [Massilia sp. CCM 9210]